jgi:AcrR family transcriptional regulator
MPRQTGEATRRAILDAAYELFYRNGYARVGVDEVAARAKVTKRTLYYHFRSKDDLLAEVLNCCQVIQPDKLRGRRRMSRHGLQECWQSSASGLSRSELRKFSCSSRVQAR